MSYPANTSGPGVENKVVICFCSKTMYYYYVQSMNLKHISRQIRFGSTNPVIPGRHDHCKHICVLYMLFLPSPFFKGS